MLLKSLHLSHIYSKRKRSINRALYNLRRNRCSITLITDNNNTICLIRYRCSITLMTDNNTICLIRYRCSITLMTDNNTVCLIRCRCSITLTTHNNTVCLIRYSVPARTVNDAHDEGNQLSTTLQKEQNGSGKTDYR